MRIKTFGAKHFTGQLPRIEEGFKKLGHEIVEEKPDLVYANNPWFDEAKAEKGGIKVFNVLDVPHHIPDYDIDRLRGQLYFADKVTTISETTQKAVEALGY